MASASRHFDPADPSGILRAHVRGRPVPVLRRTTRELHRVRDADRRTLIRFITCLRRGGPRDRGRAAPCVRASRRRSRRAVAVGGCDPSVITPTHVYAHEGLQPPGELRQEHFPGTWSRCWPAASLPFLRWTSSRRRLPSTGSLAASSASSRICASRSRWEASRRWARWVSTPCGRNATGRKPS